MKKLIMFSAAWCGPCNATKPVFHKLQQEMKEVDFQLVDVEEEDELALQYNITAVPTFVLLMDNQEVVRRAGGMSEEKLKSFINQ